MTSDLRARPSAEIGVVEVKKLRTFCDFCGARECLRRSAWSRLETRGLFAISAVPAGRRGWSLQVVAWFARLLSESRVAGSITAWSAAALLDRNRNFYVQT